MPINISYIPGVLGSGNSNLHGKYKRAGMHVYSGATVWPRDPCRQWELGWGGAHRDGEELDTFLLFLLTYQGLCLAHGFVQLTCVPLIDPSLFD